MKKRYADEVFLLGLLHSLGQIVLLVQSETQKDYLQVIKKIQDEHLDYVAAEQAVFGFSHPLLGALVAKKWNFSSDTCQIILHYKDPIEASKPELENDEKTAVVQLADLLAHAAGVGSPEGYPNEIEKIHALAKYLGFEAATMEATIEELINQTQEQFNNEKHIYD
jgi:HD-like signal output (HDOD) protein